MALARVGDVADAHAAGRARSAMFRKVPSQATTAGWWADLSMAPGTPVPNYYAATPLAAKRLDPWDGLFHGDAVAPAALHLTRFGMVATSANFAGRMILCDYLLIYPFVDCDSSDTQTMNNTVALDRYTDGVGVQVMAVAVAPTLGSGVFTFTYLDQAGVEQTSPTQYCSTTGANIATIVTSQPAVAGSPGGPFLPLASGSTGVRAITSCTFSVNNGGLMALVLVKPLLDLAIREASTEVEAPMIAGRAGAPLIHDTAYLNMIVSPAGSIASTTVTGYAEFVWSG